MRKRAELSLARLNSLELSDSDDSRGLSLGQLSIDGLSLTSLYGQIRRKMNFLELKFELLFLVKNLVKSSKLRSMGKD